MVSEQPPGKEQPPSPSASDIDRAGSYPGTQIARLQAACARLQEQLEAQQRQLQTERRRRRQGEMLLATAQRVAQLGSWEWEPETGRVTWTEELYRIYGRSPESFSPTPATFLAHVHPEDRAEVKRSLENTRSRGTPFQAHHRIVRADGIVRILHSQGRVIEGADGDNVRIFGISQDVTEARQTEIALRQSEKQYRLLARHMPDAAVILYDQELRVTLVEGTIMPFLDFTAQEMEGRSLAEILPSLPAIETEAQRLFPYREALRDVPRSFEMQVAERALRVHTLPVKDEAGNIYGGMIMLQDITRQKQSQAQLVKTAQQLSALSEMGQTVAASLDLEVIFARVVEALRPLLQAQGVAILLREGKDALYFAASSQVRQVGVGGLKGMRVSSNEGVAGEVIRTGEPQWRASEEPLVEIYPAIQEGAEFKPRAILAVPLQLQGEIIGVMEAVHSRSDSFGEDDLMTLEAAANWTAIAIGNARQHERLQQRLRESETMATISRSLSESLDMDELLQRIVAAARELLPDVEWAVLHLLQKSGRELLPAAVSGLDVDDDYLTGPAATGRQANRPREKGEAAVQTAPEGGDHHSLLVIPLETHQGKLGLLSVQSDGTHVFTENDETLLKTLGLQAAMALEKARLFEEQEQARHRAEILRAANITLSHSLDLDKVLDTLLEYMQQLIGYERANVLLLDKARAGFDAHVWRGYTEEEIGFTQKRIFDFANVQTVLQQKESMLIADVRQAEDWRYLPGRDGEAASWLGIPLLIGGEVVGLLTMIKPVATAFTDQHVTLGEALAVQAASAVQNARLFSEVENGRQRLRQLSKQVVSAQEKERQRISRELHDEAGQALTALKISLEMMRAGRQDIPEDLAAQLDEAITLIDQTMEQIRLLAHNLRPPVIDTLGLATALEGLCRNFGQRTHLDIIVEAEEVPGATEAATISIYRFVQEALTNVAKHAHATEIVVELHSDDDMIGITVADNGRGFDVEKNAIKKKRGGIGLAGMQDRFELLNGWVTVDSHPGQGTIVSAHVPHEEDQ